MARVFLSYERDDSDKAESIARALERAGHSVWWDRHIKGGAEYSNEIEEALEAADTVVVLWSARSVKSAWVRDEAAAGRDSGRLVPVRLDDTDPPLGFRQFQTIDLSGRAGRSRPAQFKTLLQAVKGAVRPEAAAESPPGNPNAARPWRSRNRLMAAAFALLAAAGLFLLWRTLAPSGSVPVVAVAAADSSPTARAMARDLFVKLGSLQSARAEPLQLVEQSSREKAALRFAIGGSEDGKLARANIILFDGQTQALLWSKDFEAPISQRSGLNQQVAFTAGRILYCALDALGAERTGLKRPVLKVYLNGCATIDELSYQDLSKLIPTFREVTMKAPRFEGGWAKLIQVEVLAAVNNPAGDPALMSALKKHIAEARKVNPHLAEAYLAEVELIDPTDHEARLRLTDLATEHNPDHPEPFAARAFYLRSVGRMNESVENGKRAAELDPLSPAISSDYISALIHAGQFEQAPHELERAERLWPGANAIRDARFIFELRHGDARAALRLSHLGASAGSPQLTQSFLQAKLEPTEQNIKTAVRQALALYKSEPSTFGAVAQVLGALGAAEEAFSMLLARPTPASSLTGSHYLFRPSLREIRRDPRFMQVAQRLGLIAYWQKTGKWPDFCFEPDLPYDCKTEAAKLAA